MANSQKKIYVYENWSSAEPNKIGTLYVDVSKGKETFSFEYDSEWLKNSSFAFILDPDLAMYNGRQFAPLDKAMFGIFSDSCPDRWGRVLMKRREATIAKREERKPRELRESDFLLGVYDESRMGALRFSLDENGPFLSDDKDMATPPWANLRTLEEASRAFEQDENALEEKWLRQLIGPGSSLGGARPKATVEDVDGTLWIAKFPSKHDEVDSGAWEMVAHDLAKLCSLDVPPAKLEKFSKLGSTFLVKRFDRDGDRRIHFASAMTMLGKADGASAADGTSYLDIVSFIKSNGGAPEKDLKELWRRIVFNMAISNIDDHLRNHGFILTPDGWCLSPLYDVNPVPYGDELSLNVSEEDPSISVELAIETSEYYGFSKNEAETEAQKILTVVKDNWERLASKYGISRSNIEYMRPAFSACESK